MNFDFTESRIEWEHNNENKFYYVDNIEFASYEKKLIYIEICNDSGYEYRYIDLNGTDIVWYTENGMLSIFGIKKKTIKLEQIEDVMIIGDNIFVMFSDKEEKKISEYSRNGEFKRQYTPPLHYSFYRFTEFEDKIAVICQEDNPTDKYGRKDWKFVYNEISAGWEKKSLAY